jgi:hypothetical protein
MIATSGLAAAVQARLVRHAKVIGMDPNLVLARFAMERLLHRLSRSEYADRFVLKGAMLMLVWLGETIRPTRDVDLLGVGELSESKLTDIFAKVCSADVEPDGMRYIVSSIRVAPIRPSDPHGGMRVLLQGRLGNARLSVQVDVGIGDSVIPAPEWIEYPALLNLPGARLRAYRPETSIAEKLHAIVVLGADNTRMRDFFDIHALSKHKAFDGRSVCSAVHATFERRRTSLPRTLPIGLTPAFSVLPGKQAQWQGFLRKSATHSSAPQLEEAVSSIAAFLGPVIGAVREGRPMNSAWPPGGPWQEES